MLEARFRMELPPDSWVAELSREYRSATFRLLTGAPVGDRALELGEVTADDPAAVADAIREHPDIVECEGLYLDDERAIARYETTEQRLYEFLREPSLPPEFPVTVRNGAMEFDVTTTRERFEVLGTALEESDYEYELLSVVEGRDPETLLTERQRECLLVALRKGYFEVPRDCTLAEVAGAVGVDTSSASETVRRGAGRVLEWFLLDAAGR